jgi:anti-sigma28 factor (negative regulator of flagellin synthesis)
MKLYDRDLTGAAAAESGRAAEAQKLGRKGGLAGQRSGGREGGDRVEFSDNLGRLARATSSYSAAQANRVEQLSAQYQSGQYRVDAAAVGKSLVDHALAAGPE